MFCLSCKDYLGASAGTPVILGERAGALSQTVFLLSEAASSMC